MYKRKTTGPALSIALLFPAAGALAAIGENANGRPGTVDYFTPAQQQHAFRAVTAAGYVPTAVQAYQDGNFFLTASKSGNSYEVTVVPSGQVYPSVPLPSAAS